MNPELDKNSRELISDLQIKVVEVIADRRSTLVLKVIRGTQQMILKLAREPKEKEEDVHRKEQLLKRESVILSQIPELTNHLYVDHGSLNQRPWLLLRDVVGVEAYQKAKKIRKSVEDEVDVKDKLSELLLKVSGFYSDLYENGYLHGDVQAAHTYLEKGNITVIDWGLAKKVGEENPLYKGGFIYFVAPEIAQHMRNDHKNESVDYNPRTEVYAIGTTLFMLYAGHLAMDFGVPKSKLRKISIEEKLDRVIKNNIFTFDDLEVSKYPELEDILRKSLSTQPGDRFANPSMLDASLRKSIG